MWQEQAREGLAVVNTFGWERKEVVILPENEEEAETEEVGGEALPAIKKPRLDHTQTLHDRSQIGMCVLL